MMLRWLVSNWVRQAAREQLRGVVTGAMQGAAASSAAETDEPLPPVDIAVVFALSIESGGLVDLLQNRTTTRCHAHTEHRGQLNERQLLIVETGVGRDTAKTVTADVIKVHQPKWVVSAGFAAALRMDLRRGHMLMADEVCDTAGKTLFVGLAVDRAAIESSPSLHIGRLVTVDELIRTQSDKEQLAAAHTAIACDMETFAVAEACGAAGTKLLSVRIISDCLDDKLPPEIESLVSQQSIVGKLGAAAGAIFNRPSSVKDMWKMKEDALKATDRLARFLTGVIEQLPRE